MSNFSVATNASLLPLTPFTPKLLSSLKCGYRLDDLKADLLSGLTVAIVALPLSMAIAIASGLSPDKGLVTAVVGGLVVSLLGGSRFQIGGPAGAFIIVVSATLARFGTDGLALATLLSGILMVAAGYCRLGVLIRHVPHTVVVAFTAAIGLIIFLSQVKDLVGLTPSTHEPRLPGDWMASFSPAAVGLAGATIAIILVLRRWRPAWPNLFLTIVALSAAAWALHLPVATIGSRFGAMARTLPMPHVPAFDLDGLLRLLPSAMSFALLGSIESLLSASVADRMSGAKHRPNCELVAQGVANMVAPLFGGSCVTGTIARTATNVRSGAKTPLSGIFCALFVLAFMIVGAPLAAYVPLSVLAAVLSVVAWMMADVSEVWRVARTSRIGAMVMAVTFLVVVFRDLSAGIMIGCVASWLAGTLGTRLRYRGREATTD